MRVNVKGAHHLRPPDHGQTRFLMTSRCSSDNIVTIQ